MPAASKPAPEKVHKLREVYFSRMVQLPGYPGACTVIGTEGVAKVGVNRAVAKSLVLVGDKLIIDGDYFMPISSGVVQGWKY